MNDARRSPPAVWGIVNATPDSFYDQGRHGTTTAAVRHGQALLEAGAEVLDVGGESTRPGADPVPVDVERDRVVPVVQALAHAARARGGRAEVSVDTRHAAVAAAAIEAGATIVNDVSAGRDDPAMLGLVADRGAGLVLMHMRGTPRTMQQDPVYDDVTGEVRRWLAERVRAARGAGVPAERIWVDPGIGFGKTVEHNLALLAGLRALVQDGVPVLLGASRKSFLGRVTGREVEDRLAGSLACVALGWEAGVRAVRVHDVAATRDLLAVLTAVEGVRCRIPAG